MAFEFTLNGRRVAVEGEPPTRTLLAWLRSQGHTGSKEGCAEGDCGACTVALLERDASGSAAYRAINSCIALLPMFAGREIVTVEGLADGGELHPAQRCMVERYGSQCGYCTPGFVVSLFEAYYREDCRTPADLSDQLCGNLCRCTGYRPIRDAALDVLRERDSRGAEADPFRDRLGGEVADLPPLTYEADGQRFFRPTSLANLFALKAAHPDAHLVAGATEIGVEINKKAKAFPVLISTEGVPELTRIHETAGAWRIGGGATLTAIEERLGAEYPSLAKMLRVFASRQIRSRATLGGNLATASPIGDGAPVLLSLDAELVLASGSAQRTVRIAAFFTGYRQTVLRPEEVILEIVLPRFQESNGLTRRADFLKVSKRRELDISIVAAAFTLDLDGEGIVRQARLAYGGVAALPRRALRAEEALLGRRLEDAAGDVSGLLAEEFEPLSDHRGGAGYRSSLVVSLWEKLVAGDRSEAQDGDLDFGAGEAWPEPDGTRSLRHESGPGHVSGRALYADDEAQRRPMLDVWPVCAPHARAKILRRDAGAALRAPGVAAVLFAEDVPGENNVGVSRHDEPLFATDEIQFHGQLVALVVGDSLAACRHAASLVEVDYEALPPLVGLRAAMAAGSFHTEPHHLARGDAAAALAASPLRVEGEIETGGQEHFYLESQAVWAEPGEEGTVLVSSSTQHPSEIQAMVAEVLGVPRNKVVTRTPRMGGGFGGKETQGNAFAALAALAAKKTGKPVRMQLDRDLDMTLTGKRHPFHARFAAGHDEEGRLLAVEVDLVADGGWSLDLSQPILDRALFHLDNAYYLPAVRFTGRVAKTNVTSHTAFRGFGGPQGMLVIEEILDRVARRLGLPPEVVRERNLYRGSGETNTTHYGVEIGDNRLREVWDLALRQADFAERRRAVEAWNREHPRIKRGLAATPVKFGISFTLTHYNQAGAMVLLYQDGSAQVNHGGTEMGQGLHTKILGIAMRELGLPADRIRLMTTSTDKVPNTSATAASAGADLNGAAVAAACATLRERLAPVATRKLAQLASREVAPKEVVFADGSVRTGDGQASLDFPALCKQAYVERVSLAATGYYKTPEINWDWQTVKGRPFYYYANVAAVAEVEVDGYNGMHRVLRVDLVEDVGDSLNPAVDRGQIEGGFVQGMGWLTREELLWNAEGRLLTHSASTYAIPAISDAPLDFRVTLLPAASHAGAIHGSKAVGEPPLMAALSVREAIRDAVAAFGEPGGEVALPSPATCEAIFQAIEARVGVRYDPS